jgi:hypothetical protein
MKHVGRSIRRIPGVPPPWARFLPGGGLFLTARPAAVRADLREDFCYAEPRAAAPDGVFLGRQAIRPDGGGRRGPSVRGSARHLARRAFGRPAGRDLHLGGKPRIVGEKIEGAPDLLVEALSRRARRAATGTKSSRSTPKRAFASIGFSTLRPGVTFLVNDAGRFAVIVPSGMTYRSPKLPEVELDVEDSGKCSIGARSRLHP